MKDLRDHWEPFSRRLSEAPWVCVLSDFDGTLTPLFDRPEVVPVPPRLRRALRTIAEAPRTTLGIVSGRALSDIAERIGVSGVWYVGNHGLEIRSPSGELVRLYKAEDVAFLEELRNELARAMAAIPGVLFEPKGPVLAVHYRLVPEGRRAEVERIFLSVLQHYVRRVEWAEGKLVWEARIRTTCDKGTAVHAIRKELPEGAATVYFGDDRTDQDAFRALEKAGISIQVGPAEAPFADYSLPNADAVLEILERIGRLLGPPRVRPVSGKEATP